MKKFRPSAGLAISLLAIFVALSGGAYAAGLITHGQLASNSVWHNNIGNGSVQTSNLKDRSVGHNKLKDNSVWHNNIGNGSVQKHNLSADIQTELAQHGTPGPQGPVGPTGPQGPVGPAGPQGTSGVINPLIYHFSGTTGPDGGNCGNKWATDTYDATFIVEPQVAPAGAPDGYYTIVKIIDGTFVTKAGTSQPNPPPPGSAGCPGTLQTGGVTGTFHGTMSWNVPSPGTGQAPTLIQPQYVVLHVHQIQMRQTRHLMSHRIKPSKQRSSRKAPLQKRSTSISTTQRSRTEPGTVQILPGTTLGISLADTLNQSGGVEIRH